MLAEIVPVVLTHTVLAVIAIADTQLSKRLADC